MKQTYIRYISLGILLVIIVFQAYLYRAELSIPTEVNDNNFQYALVHEAGKIWKDVFAGKRSVFALFDSVNERWNEGFALSNYYSHIPQAVISGIGLLLGIDLFSLFTVVKYLFLILLPVSFFVGGLILTRSYLYAIILAFFSQIICTDGLYGIDASSFLWRGWGLSSQLFAIFFVPLAFAFTYCYIRSSYAGLSRLAGSKQLRGAYTRANSFASGIKDKKYLITAILLNVCIAQCHSGVFFMLVLSYPVMAIFFTLCHCQPRQTWQQAQEYGKRLLYVGAGIFVLIAYVLMPFVLEGQYRNFSYWDPLWKFNSLGIYPILAWLLNGDLFDFGRIPVITYAAIGGIFIGFIGNHKTLQLLSILFLMYMVLFFGSTGLGGFINSIPGFSEFHQHRFVALVQIMGLYVAAWVVYILFKQLQKRGNTALIGGVVLFSVWGWSAQKPVIKYAKDNAVWLASSQIQFQKDAKNYSALVEMLSRAPVGRIYAGRPGNWGRETKVGDTPLYMALAKDGFATVGSSPESWSPNSEYDQFFNDYDIRSYELYNARYIVAPSTFKKPDFAQLIATFGNYYVYRVNTEGWFGMGRAGMVVTGKKNHFINITHLWLNNNLKDNVYPIIQYNSSFSDNPNDIHLIDESTYQKENGDPQSIWKPVFVNDFQIPLKAGALAEKNMLVQKKETQKPDIYSISFRLEKNCSNCLLILKETYHPNWKAIMNGKAIKTYPVFPFYIGIPIEQAGSYTVEVSYRPGFIKIILLLTGIVCSIWYIVGDKKRVLRSK